MNRPTTTSVWTDDKERIARLGKLLAEMRGLLAEVHAADKLRMILDYVEQEMGEKNNPKSPKK